MSARSGSAGLTKGLSTFLAIVGVATVVEGMLVLLRMGALPGTTLHTVLTVAIHAIGLPVVFLVVAPPIGQLVTASIGQLFRSFLALPSLLAVLRVLRLLHVVLLLVSPWYVHHTWRVLGWPGLVVAYLYLAIVGGLIGGILLLNRYLSKAAP